MGTTIKEIITTNNLVTSQIQVTSKESHLHKILKHKVTTIILRRPIHLIMVNNNLRNHRITQMVNLRLSIAIKMLRILI